MSAHNAGTMAKQLDERESNTYITVITNDRQHTASWEEAGLTIDGETTIEAASNYPLWQRLIPFSSAVRMTVSDTQLQIDPDQQKLTAFTEKIAKTSAKPAVDANLSIQNGKVVRHKQSAGQSYKATVLKNQILETAPEPNARIVADSTKIQPKQTLTDIEPTAKKAEKILAATFTLSIQDKNSTVPAAEIGNWLVFQPTEGGLTLGVDKNKVKAYVDAQGKSVYRAPGKSTVTLRDGQEIQRTPTNDGQAVDSTKAAETASAVVLKANSAKIPVPIQALPPTLVYNRTYTRSTLGMQTLLNDLIAQKPNMAITVRAMDGTGISASANGNKAYNPASTYKLPLAYEILKRFSNGTLSPAEPVNGTSAEQCLNIAIVRSDNPCAIALGEKISWQALQDSARSIGMSGTQLNSRGGFVSTTNDQALLLTKLVSGELLPPAQANQLISLMKQQVYRQGVPKGAAGSEVADKPGFIGSLIHDSAIVYGPRGPYVVVIYSSQSSWKDVSDAAARIHDLMKQ